MTRHFSQFLFSPYGEGEGLRAVDPARGDEQILAPQPRERDEAAEIAGAADALAWPPLAAVPWPLTHRPFDDDEPEVADGHFASADEETDAEAAEEADAHAARAALLAEVYGWPHRAM